MGVTCKTVRFVGNGARENSQQLSKRETAPTLRKRLYFNEFVYLDGKHVPSRGAVGLCYADLSSS